MSAELAKFEEDAQLAWARRDFSKMRDLSDQFLSSASQDERIFGLMLRQRALEALGSDSGRELEESLRDAEEIVSVAPAAEFYMTVARLQMKFGVDRYQDALAALRAGERLGSSPGLLLGFAHYYRTKKEPDIEKAKGYYWNAIWK